MTGSLQSYRMNSNQSKDFTVHSQNTPIRSPAPSPEKPSEFHVSEADLISDSSSWLNFEEENGNSSKTHAPENSHTAAVSNPLAPNYDKFEVFSDDLGSDFSNLDTLSQELNSKCGNENEIENETETETENQIGPPNSSPPLGPEPNSEFDDAAFLAFLSSEQRPYRSPTQQPFQEPVFSEGEETESGNPINPSISYDNKNQDNNDTTANDKNSSPNFLFQKVPLEEFASNFNDHAPMSSAVTWSVSPEWHLKQNIDSKEPDTSRLTPTPKNVDPSVAQSPEPSKKSKKRHSSSLEDEKTEPPKEDSSSPKEQTPDSKKNNKKGVTWQSRLTGFVTPLEPQVQQDTKNDPQLEVSNHNPQPSIFLSEEQKRVLHFIVYEGRNIFFTGAAGTGKSVLLKRIINELRKRYRDEGSVAVTASTGLAACNIGGTTLHSFTGIGLGKEPVDKLLKKIRYNRRALKRWKSIRVLVIDEISMIDGALFDKLENLARLIRRDPSPFGGIQVILTGDFFQLPPVFKKDIQMPGDMMPEIEENLAFQSQSWKDVVSITVELKQVFRQKDDRFSRMLSSIREGAVTDEISKEFKSLSRPLKVPYEITPTELFPLRKDVDVSNNIKMKNLPGKLRTYLAVDEYVTAQAREAEILRNMMCPERLDFKIGAQVMLIKNLDETLVNGSLGKIVGFMNDATFQLVEELPEKQANSIISGKMTAEETVESLLGKQDNSKSTEDNNKDNNEKEKEKNDTATATASKVIHPIAKNDPFSIPHDYIELDEDEDNDNFVNWKRKKAIIDSLNKATESTGKIWPLVRFAIPDGTTRDVLVQEEKWEIENLDGNIEASRSQVPLIPAWALSIHKSQGQTLSWVKVNLSRIFECGQAYVALSRATTMEGLQVLEFHSSKVKVHPDVIDFYKSLPSPLDIPYLNDSEIETEAPKKKAKKNKKKKEKRK